MARLRRLAVGEPKLRDLEQRVRIADERRGVGVVLELPVAQNKPEAVAVEADARIEVATTKPT